MSSYDYHLAVDVYEGSINDIKIRWQPGAKSMIPGEAIRTGLSEETVKAMTEHFLYLSAHRLQCKSVKINAPPHQFTIDSVTKEVKDENAEHISGAFSGGKNGKLKVHVYLTREWGLMGETVMGSKGKGINRELSTGRWPGQPESSEAGQASTSVGDTTLLSASGESAVTAQDSTQYTEWELCEDGRSYRRYNYTAELWEYS